VGVGVVTRRAAVTASSFVLEHVPDLVRYGSKPRREPQQLEAIAASLRTYDSAVAYAPNQVFIGALEPEDLWERPRDWWRHPVEGAKPDGSHGDVMPQHAFYALLAEVDRFDLVRRGAEPGPGELALFDGDDLAGSFSGDHEADESLTAHVLLENLAIKASGVHAVRDLLARTGIDPSSITHAIGCGEEAVGDRYQRGGGNVAKAIAEECGLARASAIDVKSFCAAPVHAIVLAAALIEAGIEERVVVVAGGSLGKLGMKFEGALAKGFPVLEDVLAGMAVLLEPADGSNGPIVRTDAVGRMPVEAGSAPQAQLEALVGAPLDELGIAIGDVSTYATEIHNPEITEPQGGGDVPDRNYKMLAGLGVVRGELERDAIAGFAREHGLPGFSPTQGHIASAVPWVPHALARMRAGDLRRTMLIAKGSLFLGRLTRLWDGVSVTLEA
jgi:glycine/sarcosine/betaine reductase complex component C subunit beta